MTAQRCNTAEPQGYGEPQNGLSNEKTSNADETVVCPACEGRGRLPKIRSSISEDNQNRRIVICKNKNLPYASSEITISARRSACMHRFPRLPSMHLPTLKGTISREENCRTKMAHLLDSVGVKEGINEKIDRRTERMLRSALMKLSSTEWEVRKEGLEECLHISQHYPDEVDLHMNQVYSAMRHLLGNHRQRDTSFVCQVARGFFARLRSTCKPEFDNFVLALLVRTADSSFYIKCYVNDALDKMVTYIPSVHAIRPLVEKGCKHKNPLVRTSAVRLLADIVTFRTPVALLTQPHLRDPCKKIIEAGAQLLADNSWGTRAAAKILFSKFVHEEAFEMMYDDCSIDGKLKKRIGQAISVLKQMQIES